MSASNEAPQASTELFEAVEENYDIAVQSIRPLAGEFSETWLLEATDERRFVLKTGDATSLPQRRLQADFLAHLAAHDSELPVPAVVPTRKGQALAEWMNGVSRQHLQVLTWMPGRMMSELHFRDAALLREVGRVTGRLAAAAQGLNHVDALRTHLWDLRRADEQILAHVDHVAADRRDLVLRVVEWFRTDAQPKFEHLPTAVVHQDLNDFNVLAQLGDDFRWHLSGVVDFGDVLETVRVADLAIAVTYAMLREAHPLDAAIAVVAGYVEVTTLSEDELACILPLAAARLAVNATVWGSRLRLDSADHYAASRMARTWPLLEKLVTLDREFATATIRAAANIEPLRINRELSTWLQSGPHVDAPLLLDGRDLGALEPDGVACSGREEILVRPSLSPAPEATARRRTRPGEAATLVLGTQFVARDALTAVAPYEGEVVRRAPERQLLLVRYAASSGETFWLQYAGLNDLFVQDGERVGRGCRLGTASPEDGEETSLVVTLCGDEPEQWLPARVRPGESEVWEQRCPNPAQLFRLPRSGVLDDAATVTSIRQAHLASSQRAYYVDPMNVVSARGTWFTDSYGRRYLDAINNVTHVGHGHPHVVQAATRQLSRLNTNSRFTYSALAHYAERLAATLPDPLEVVFFTCTGSEANDLALRIARSVTARDDVAVLAGAYHGNTTAVMGISPNRYRGAGGCGPPPTTHELPQPNLYRGPYGYDHPSPGAAYATDAAAIIADLVTAGRAPAAVFAESLMGTAGQIVLPPGYLSGIFETVRAASGLCVSDEVQVGVGRLGNTFWGFQGHNVIPDIVTMGKPLGNGYPLAAVVTTRAIADAFDNGMKYFNTFAGNPVACAVGEAVLDVVERESLQEHAAVTGAYFKRRLLEVADASDYVGDVRGQGLYLGVELVVDRATKTPARALAYRVSERLKDEGVLTYPNGDLDNVLKIKPPMVFSVDDVDVMVDTLAEVLQEMV